MGYCIVYTASSFVPCLIVERSDVASTWGASLGMFTELPEYGTFVLNAQVRLGLGITKEVTQ